MDPATDERLDYVDEECGGSQKMQYHQAALAEEGMINEDDEYDDLYNDINVGEGFLQMQTQVASVAGNSNFQTPKPSETRAEATIASQETSHARVANESGFVAAAVHSPEQNTSFPSQKEGLLEITHMTATDRMDTSEKMIGIQQNSTNQINSNPNVSMNHAMDEVRPSLENGNTMLFVGELHWWTTDSEIESVLIRYGKVKEIKFFDERTSGKSKGYCQVEFYDPSAASACLEGMNGHIFNGRACVVTFASSQSLRQMGASYTNKNQSQTQPQQLQGRNYPGGDGGRNFRRGGWGRRNQTRGRGGMGNRNYGTNLNGPGFGGPHGMMHPQGMMSPGFDLAFMGQGAGYGGFSGHGFPGMMPPFQGVNPAFFGRGMAPHLNSGMWNDANMGRWGGEEHVRESSYGEDNVSEYECGEVSRDKGVRSSDAPRETERNSEPPEKRHREEKQEDGEIYDSKDSRYREEKDQHHKDRDMDHGEDWDRGQSSRSRSRSGAVAEDATGLDLGMQIVVKGDEMMNAAE